MGFAHTIRDSSAATTYKLWCNLNGESEVGESGAVALNCEFEELLDRRGVTERITQWKTSEDGQCVIIVYVNDMVTIDSEEFSEIVQSLFEFSGAQSISLGFSRVKRSPIVNVYRRKP